MSGQAQDTFSGRPTYVRLSDAERERLSQEAQRQERTLSWYVRMLVREHIAALDADEPEPLAEAA